MYVTDTHPLVWYASSKHRRLSKKVQSAFDAASHNEALTYVPAFVLWEVAMLLKVGRITLREPYGDWAEHLLAQQGFALAPIDVLIITEAYTEPFSDSFDSIITAIAKVMDLPLMTNDSDIRALQLVDVYREVAPGV